MSDTPRGSQSSSPVRMNTPVHRVSRWQQGLPPETPGQPAKRGTVTSSSLVTEVSFQAIPAVTIQAAHAGFDISGRRAPMQKCDFWRIPDRQPLCHHCCEAGHFTASVGIDNRQFGLCSFPINSPRAQVGQRPREIEDYPAQQCVPYSRRQSRSPSPRRRSPIWP
ncbi:hypothetical protein HPB50_028180 [Hyalomma asiaticum]|nr:hypothetical protein HPB50_028180 [Hyalomma asiaticum]